jgi:hypothetical protein
MLHLRRLWLQAEGDEGGVGPMMDDDLMPMDDNVDFEDIPRDADGQETGGASAAL